MPKREQPKDIAMHQILSLMEFWDIDEIDILGVQQKRRKPKLPQSNPIRYKHPQTGETWDGLGQQPAWIKRALITEGLYLRDLTAFTGAPVTS